MDMHIHEARHEVLAGRIDDLSVSRRLEALADLCDLVSIDKDIGYAVKSDLRVDHMRASKQKCHCSLLPGAGTSRPCG